MTRAHAEAVKNIRSVMGWGSKLIGGAAEKKGGGRRCPLKQHFDSLTIVRYLFCHLERWAVASCAVHPCELHPSLFMKYHLVRP